MIWLVIYLMICYMNIYSYLHNGNCRCAVQAGGSARRPLELFTLNQPAIE